MKMNIKMMFGLAAVAGLMTITMPVERAHAVSLMNPGVSTSAGETSKPLATEIRWRRHHHHRWHGHHGWRHRHHGWHRSYGWHRPHGWHHHRHGHRRHHWY